MHFRLVSMDSDPAITTSCSRRCTVAVGASANLLQSTISVLFSSSRSMRSLRCVVLSTPRVSTTCSCCPSALRCGDGISTVMRLGRLKRASWPLLIFATSRDTQSKPSSLPSGRMICRSLRSWSFIWAIIWSATSSTLRLVASRLAMGSTVTGSSPSIGPNLP